MEQSKIDAGTLTALMIRMKEIRLPRATRMLRAMQMQQDRPGLGVPPKSPLIASKTGGAHAIVWDRGMTPRF